MKIIVNYLIFSILILLGSGCNKDPLPDPWPCKLPDCSDTIKPGYVRPDHLGVLPIVWYTTAKSPDTLRAQLLSFATEDGVITINNLEYGNSIYVRKLAREDGRELWYWDNLKADHYTDVHYYPERHLLLVKYWYYHAVINTQTGEEIINMRLPAELGLKEPRADLIGDYIYTGTLFKDNDVKKDTDWARIYRIHIYTGKIEEVYYRDEKEVKGFTPYFENFALWVQPQSGDSIILINNRMYHWERYFELGANGGVDRTDLIAFNLNKRKVEWIRDSICAVSSNSYPFVVEGNDLYYKAPFIAKLDLFQNGKTNWNIKNFGYTFSEDLSHGIIIGETKEGIGAVDKESGALQWSTPIPDLVCRGYGINKDYMYFSSPSGNIYGANINTGKIVYSEFPGNMVFRGNHGCDGSASVDKEHNLLYFSDSYGTYCLKLPDMWDE